MLHSKAMLASCNIKRWNPRALLPAHANAFKNNPVLRKKVADEADTILAKIKEYM